MRARVRLLVFLLPLVALACMRPPRPRPPEHVHTIAVLPPNNRTGDALLVAGTSVLEKYALGTERVTVPDVLAGEARVQLRERGFELISPDAVAAVTDGRAPASSAAAIDALAKATLRGSALFLEIRRWEGDAGTHPAFVIVGLDAALIDIATGRTIWSWRPAVHPVATPGAVNLGVAHQIAARVAVTELLASWEPGRDAP